MTNPLAAASFLKGVGRLAQLPADTGTEVAFAGRSNAGKSSAINKLVGARALARTSKTPGRTREINFFTLDSERRLVDLPGYGYAKVSKSMQQHWGGLLHAYLSERHSLAGVVLIMDVRRPFTDLDEQLISCCMAARLPVHGLLTKADKMGRGRGAQALHAAQKHARAWGDSLSLQLFSARESTGLEPARVQVAAWLGLSSG